MLQGCSTLPPCKNKWSSVLTTVNAGEIRSDPFVKNNEVDDLTAEFLRYIEAVDGSDVDIDIPLISWTAKH